MADSEVRVAQRLIEAQHARAARSDRAQRHEALLVTPMAIEAALSGLGDALRDVQDSGGSIEGGVAPTPRGAGFWFKSHELGFDDVIAALVRGLQARGVHGLIDVHETKKVHLPLDRYPDLIGCRVRLAGKRARLPAPFSQRAVWWILADGVLDRLIGAAVDWCEALSPAGERYYSSELIYGRLGPEDDLEAFLRTAIPGELKEGRPRATGSVTYISSQRMRSVTFSLPSSRATFFDGGHDLTQGGWLASVSAIRELMTGAADWATYAFARRGTQRIFPDAMGLLLHDWPERPGYSAMLGDAGLNEDAYVPDPFGLQLLGNGHADRVPSTPNWRSTPLPSGHQLLEHVDLDSWYSSPAPPLAAIEQAREDFGALLIDDDIYDARGRTLSG